MNDLEAILSGEYPESVQYRHLWEVTYWDKRFIEVENSKQPKVLKYQYLLASELKALAKSTGDIKLLTTNKSDLWTLNEHPQFEVSDAEIVALPWGGNPIVQYYSGKFLTADNRIAVARNPDELDVKFLYYVLSERLKEISDFYRGSGIKHPSMAKVLDMLIPIPPIKVQREIVRILDKFTELEAELEAELETELEARKFQYDHYLTSLIDFDGRDSQCVKVSEICRISRGTVISKDYLRDHPGIFPVYSSQTLNNGIFGYIDTFAYDFESLTWTTDGANAGSIFFHQNEKFTITNVCGLLRVLNPERVSTRYLYYVLSAEAPKHVSAGMGNPKLMAGTMGDIQIKLPSLEEQEEIVKLLDRFEAIISGITEAIPAEIAARRQQYEYYRSKLLTFKELEVA